MFEDFLVMEWAWLEEAFNDEEIEQFYGMLDKASENKPDCSYFVCKEDSPYAEKIYDVLSRRKPPEISKEELLKRLRDLIDCDTEIGCTEVLELLLRYINDKSITRAIDKVSKNWFKRNVED